MSSLEDRRNKALKAKADAGQSFAEQGNSEMPDFLFLSSPVTNEQDVSEGVVGVLDGQKLVYLPTDNFYVVGQVRTEITEEDIEEKRSSFIEHGQLTPIVVAPKDARGYRILEGETRWRGSQRIPGHHLYAFIKEDAAEAESLDLKIMQTVVNNARKNLPLLDTALVVEEMIQANFSHTEIAIKLSLYHVHDGERRPNLNRVAAYEKLSRLPNEAKALVKDKILNDLEAIATLQKIYEISPEKGTSLCALIRGKAGISRAELTKTLKSLKAPKESPKTPKPKGEGSEKSANGQVDNGYENTHVTEDNSSQAHQHGLKQPTIHVMWNSKKAVLVLDKPSINPGEAFIRMANGDEISVECEELRFARIEHN